MARNRLTHGLSHTKEYNVWKGMMYRCFNERSNRYKNYAERGITVCDDWMSFEGFYADIGDIPEGFSLERVDVNKGYCADNCILIEKRKQAWNRTDTAYVNLNGNCVSIAELSDSTGINISTLKYRVKTGFDDHRILSKDHGLAKYVEIDGEAMTLRDASIKYDINLNTIRSRFKRGDRGTRLVR